MRQIKAVTLISIKYGKKINRFKQVEFFEATEM
jgi:hypothetical protein